MKIKIYQINSDRDVNNMLFLASDKLEKFQGSSEVDSKIYDKIYEAEVNCVDLEDVFVMFNLNCPDDFKGHSLSASDIVEITESDTLEDGFYFCDSIGFKKVAFHPELCQVSHKTLKVFVYGAYTHKSYGGKLIEVKIIAESEKMANKMMRDIKTNSKCIDTDKGYFLNDEYDYKE